jgi:hypothetical protein
MPHPRYVDELKLLARIYLLRQWEALSLECLVANIASVRGFWAVPTAVDDDRH